MKILLGGIVAVIVGVIGLIAWWTPFLEILKGAVPIILVLGGALAIYLGIEDIKTSASIKEEEPKKEEVKKETKE